MGLLGSTSLTRMRWFETRPLRCRFPKSTSSKCQESLHRPWVYFHTLQLIPKLIREETDWVWRAECCPNNGTLYSQIKKEAISNAGKPVRQMQRLDKHVKTFKPIANHAANLEHERRKKVDGKKMRDDKDKVQEILFALFEKHQYYNIKDLAHETRQPMAYLREILNEVCVYSVKPPHRNMWELKPEYRHYKQDEEEGESSSKKGGLDSDSD